jgi:DNA primase
MIPAGFIEDLLTRVDIVDVVGRHVALKKNGQNHVGLCPFHGERTPSFTVSPGKQFYHCFGCGAHGTAIGFLMDHRGLPFVEAVQELAQQAGLQVPQAVSDDGESGRRLRSLSERLDRATRAYRDQLKGSAAAIEYLKSRGLTGRTAATFALGYAIDDWQGLKQVFDDYDSPQLLDAGLVIDKDGRRYDRFRGRVMYPIRNRRGAVIGFGARSMDGSEPKYLNSPETPLFRKGQELYGLYEAADALRRRGRAIVCEGYMDVIQLAQAGFEESVAALGTAVGSSHVETLLRLVDHVIFSFDGDAAGRKAARRALEASLPALADTKRVEFLLLPEGEDPDSLIRSHGAAAFEAELARALPLSRFLVEQACEGKDMETAEGRAAALAEAKPLLQTMPPGALRLQLLDELARVARSRPDDVESLFELRPWRRLGGSSRAAGRRGGDTAALADLKTHLLQRLLANPALAREFNAAIAAECLDSSEPVDRQIAEVWRAATSTERSNSGALLEALAESEHATLYRSLLAREMLLEIEPDAAHAELEAIFARLELRRLDAELAELAAQPAPGPEVLEKIRNLYQRRALLITRA